VGGACVQVFKDWQDFRYKFGDKVARLSTRAFLSPLKEDEEITASLAPGRDVTIKYKAKGELQVRLHTCSCLHLHGLFNCCATTSNSRLECVWCPSPVLISLFLPSFARKSLIPSVCSRVCDALEIGLLEKCPNDPGLHHFPLALGTYKRNS
jgi:hypothetical protein